MLLGAELQHRAAGFGNLIMRSEISRACATGLSYCGASRSRARRCQLSDRWIFVFLKTMKRLGWGRGQVLGWVVSLLSQVPPSGQSPHKDQPGMALHGGPPLSPRLGEVRASEVSG